MKLITSFLLLVNLVFAVGFGENLNSWRDNLSDTKEYAKKVKKPIMIFIHSRNCFYCPKLIEEVFPSEVFKKYYGGEKKFLLLALDGSTDADSIEEGLAGQAPQRLITSMTPAFYFMGPNEEKLSKKGTKHMIIYGNWTPEQLVEWGKDAMRRYKKLYEDKYK